MTRKAGSRLAALVLCGIAACSAAAAEVVPQVFSPGVISGPASEDSAAFSPDGNTIYFDRIHWPNAAIMVSHRVHGIWSAPHIAPFTGEWLDHDPAMAPDGSFLVFSSNRPGVKGGKALDAVLADGKRMKGSGGHLWRVDRKGAGWGVPVRLPDVVNASTRIYAPSVAADGSVYFQQPDPHTDDFKLYRSPYRDGRYLAPVPVALGTPTSHELDPAIAPDKSFIVFDANYAGKDGADRLYIAFHEGDRWSAPLDLGDAVNRGAPWGSHLGPDRRTLYFSSPRSIPVSYPRTRQQAGQDLLRMQAWDNGNDNLWSVSLDSWLDAHRHAAG